MDESRTAQTVRLKLTCSLGYFEIIAILAVDLQGIEGAFRVTLRLVEPVQDDTAKHARRLHPDWVGLGVEYALGSMGGFGRF